MSNVDDNVMWMYNGWYTMAVKPQLKLRNDIIILSNDPDFLVIDYI